MVVVVALLLLLLLLLLLPEGGAEPSRLRFASAATMRQELADAARLQIGQDGWRLSHCRMQPSWNWSVNRTRQG